MKKLLIAILIILLIILILIIGAGIYIYINIKPFLFSDDISIDNANINSQAVDVPSDDKHPLLTANQEATLEKIGIDPAKLPTEITPAMEECFIDKLGAERVEAIKKGEAPGIFDVLKARSCLSN